MKLILEIELGNEEMQTVSDVEGSIARSFEALQPDQRLNASCGGVLRDVNGNTLGKWEVSA